MSQSSERRPAVDHRLRIQDPAGDDQRPREQGVLVGHRTSGQGQSGVAWRRNRSCSRCARSSSMAAGRPPDGIEDRCAAQHDRGLRARRGELAGRRQRPIEESCCGVDQLAIGGRRDRLAQREHRPPVAVVGAEAADPRAIDRAEIPEAAARTRRRRRRGSEILARRSARPPPSPAFSRGAGRPGVPGPRRRRSSRVPDRAATRSRAA